MRLQGLVEAVPPFDKRRRGARPAFPAWQEHVRAHSDFQRRDGALTAGPLAFYAVNHIPDGLAVRARRTALGQGSTQACHVCPLDVIVVERDAAWHVLETGAGGLRVLRRPAIPVGLRRAGTQVRAARTRRTSALDVARLAVRRDAFAQ